MNHFYRFLALTFIVASMDLFGAAAFGQSFDVCQLYGHVFVAENPNEANFRVYLEDSEAFADLVVYLEDNRLFADEPGLWYLSEAPAFANFSIYFVNKRGLADFTIYYTDILSFAGCKN